MDKPLYPQWSIEASRKRKELAAFRAFNGAGGQEITEAIWVASEMRAGAAYAHSMIALDAMKPQP